MEEMFLVKVWSLTSVDLNVDNLVIIAPNKYRNAKDDTRYDNHLTVQNGSDISTTHNLVHHSITFFNVTGSNFLDWFDWFTVSMVVFFVEFPCNNDDNNDDSNGPETDDDCGEDYNHDNKDMKTMKMPTTTKTTVTTCIMYILYEYVYYDVLTQAAQLNKKSFWSCKF